ncbi:hypothetical protein GOP47_0017717 [Adiantum capillus-veneris]|uniref:Uncharacterized protein n=1 Tax=Adiantum capillus-veneris TaxID=13818 RepID=A0A9D4UFX7_ADICA|nr:hypothetical protein GOP47_0017717 [Adiantum capillus-veneris]
METGYTSKLISGGLTSFKALFKEVVGCMPTQAECEEGNKHGFTKYMNQLREQGTPLKKGPPLATQTGVDEEYETSDEDDEDYVAEEEMEINKDEDMDEGEDEDEGDSC